jgi:hypothetical protein
MSIYLWLAIAIQTAIAALLGIRHAQDNLWVKIGRISFQ